MWRYGVRKTHLPQQGLKLLRLVLAASPVPSQKDTSTTTRIETPSYHLGGYWGYSQKDTSTTTRIETLDSWGEHPQGPQVRKTHLPQQGLKQIRPDAHLTGMASQKDTSTTTRIETTTDYPDGHDDTLSERHIYHNKD